MSLLKDNMARDSWKPVKVSRGRNFKKSIKEIVSIPGAIVVDQYEKNLEELFLLRNPKHRFNKNYSFDFGRFKEKHFGGGPPELSGNWFFFPWLNQLVHFLPEKLHQELRTGRNRYLITQEEQGKFYNSTIGILGMSVGSHAALTIAMMGGAKHIKLADPDVLLGDNLNRIRTGFQNIGLNKAIAVARGIHEINPYTKIELYSEGLTEKNMPKFLAGLDVLIEEMDEPYFKIKVRFEARGRGLPVIMAADNGDGIIADVERFDLKRNYPCLHGLLRKIKPEDLKNIPPENLPAIMAKIAGADIANLRMLKSVLEVGRSLYSWPQLGTAATMCGSVLAYLARRIVLKDKKIKSGRYEVNPDAVFESDYHSQKAKDARERERKKILKNLV